jgi:NitT/TauT family transport system permease protein
MIATMAAMLNSPGRFPGMVRFAISMVAMLLVWQLLTSTIVTNRLLLVPPAEVCHAFIREVQSGAMWTNAKATIIAVAAAFPVAVLIGIAIGLALASSRALSLMGGPMLAAFNSVPIVALAPLFIAWLGLGFASKFILVLMVSFFPVVVTTEAGLRATDKHLIETAQSFNASGWQVFSTVTFPYALPFIVSGIRVAWARALVGIVVAEFFGSFAGFGYAVMAAGQTFDTATLLAYVMVLGILGLVGSVILQSVEEKMAPWRQA